MTVPSQCRRCGAPILWVPRTEDPDKWNRPLDLASGVRGLCLVDGQAHFTECYQPHVCRSTDLDQRRLTDLLSEVSTQLSTLAPIVAPVAPALETDEVEERDLKAETDERAAHRDVELLAAQEQERQERNMRWEAHILREREKLEAQYARRHAEAVHVACPKCGASRKILCWDLQERRYGRRRHTDTPHADRLTAARSRITRKRKTTVETD